MSVVCPLGYLTSGASPGSPVLIMGYVSPGTASSATAGRQRAGASVSTFSGTTNAYLRAYCSIPKKNPSLVPAWIHGFEVDGQ